MINHNITYTCFIYFPENKVEHLRQFLSYDVINNEMISNNLYLPYLDFDRIIEIPDSVDDDQVQEWIEENWKVSSNSLESHVGDEGIFFYVKGDNPTYLLKKMSKLINRKIKMLYLCIDTQSCGEYFAFPDKEDGVDLLYQPFITAPAVIIDEISQKLGVHFTAKKDLEINVIDNE